MRWKHNDLDSLSLSLCGTGTSSSSEISSEEISDREALAAFYEATNGHNWENNANWLTDHPIDSWHGVITDDTGRVIGLRLIENGFARRDSTGIV